MPDAPPRHSQLSLLAALGTSICAVVLAAVLAEGSTPGADTVVWAPGATNGIQPADLPIVAVAGLNVGACAPAVLGRTTRLRVLAAASAAFMLTFVAVTLIKGDGPDSGRTVITVAEGTGLNSGDLPVVGVWLVGMFACLVLAATTRRHVPSPHS